MSDENVPPNLQCKVGGEAFTAFLQEIAERNAEHLQVISQPLRRTVLIRQIKYCPNGECLNFEIEVKSERVRCPICAWEYAVEKKKQSESATEDMANRKTA
jgi:hypothetical protein